MKILKFDIKKGIFHYITTDLEVDTHSHPAVEFIKAEKGTFSIETDFGKQSNLTFAIIDANLNHKMTSEQNDIEFLLIECNNLKLKEYLLNCDIELENDVFTSTDLSQTTDIIADVLDDLANENLKLTNDKRIYTCIEIIETEKLQYRELTSTLSSKVFLSESRLSHLFKENVGISMKRYFLWHKLKYALDFLLSEETNLKEASFKAGFFDQAHLSNTFKSFLGVNPAIVFNSGTIQL